MVVGKMKDEHKETPIKENCGIEIKNAFYAHR